MKLFSALTVSAAVILLTACNTDTKTASDAADKLALQVCQIDQGFDISKCKKGNRLYFAPSRFGNEQLPIFVINFYCDIRKPVYFNNGGVVCIFRDNAVAAYE